MSADNGIYVAKFPDGYRVTHATAIENLDYYPKGSPKYIQTWKDYFGKAPIFASKVEALLYAHEIAANEPILEHGVNYLGESNIVFD